MSTHGDEQDAWRRWEAALARIRERHQSTPSRGEQRLWLLAHVLSFGLLSWAMGYAVHRDGPWSPFVAGDGIVLACTLALIVVRVWQVL